MRINFVYGHGSGNAFPVVDARAMSLEDEVWGAVAVALSDRRGPVGSDGLLLLTECDTDAQESCGAAFGFRMFNADGSEAETCLNGLRLVARMGFEALGLSEARVALRISVASVARVADLAPGVATIREVAGPASLAIRDWPMEIDCAEIVDAAVPMLPGDRRWTAVAMPNPHLVSFVEAIDEAALVAVGQVCEAAPDWLPNRANVSFVEVRGEDALFVRTFERGVGLTDSCGSAMAASTYAAALTARIAFGREVTVFNRGGLVRARADADAMVTLSGNATYEWAGSAEIDLAARRASDVRVERRFEEEIAAWAAVAERASGGEATLPPDVASVEQ